MVEEAERAWYHTRWVRVAAAQLVPSLPPFAALTQAADGGGVRETDRRQIEVDLSRSAVRGLKVADAQKAALRRLLRAWCVLRPDLGYSQAMNFVGVVAITVAAGDEEGAFAIFVALMQRLPADFYAEAPPLRGFQVEVATLTALLEEHLPGLLTLADGALLEALPLIACKW